MDVLEKLGVELHTAKEELADLEVKLVELQSSIDGVVTKLASGEYELQAGDLKSELVALEREELSLEQGYADKRLFIVRKRQELRDAVLNPPEPTEAESSGAAAAGAGELSDSLGPPTDVMKSLMMSTLVGNRTLRGTVGPSLMGGAAAGAGAAGGGGTDDHSLTTQWQVGVKDMSFDKSAPPLGSGAYGEVFRGRFQGKEVAIKRLNVQQFDDATMEEFEREVAVMVRLRHPNILLFMGACTAPGNLAMITELMRGSVYDVLRDPSIPLTATHKIGFMRDTALGMAYLHGQHPSPVLHNDLKCSNLLVDSNYVVKVSDFGLARMMPKGEGRAGSPLYMAPEMLLDREYDTMADVYSFAICMWEICAGRDPYEGRFKTVELLADAVAKHGERPTLPPDADSQTMLQRAQSTDQLRRSGGAKAGPPPLAAQPPKLLALIQACWNPTPKNRPTFAAMVGDAQRRRRTTGGGAGAGGGKPTIFAEIAIAANIAVASEPMRAVWLKNFGDDMEVSWREFLVAFSNAIGFQIPKEPDDLRIACLKSMVVQSARPGDARAEVVTVADFGKMAEWFGPITEDMGDAFLDNMCQSLRLKGFHGFVDTPDAEKAVSGKKPGTFLVRFSTRDPGCYAITVLSKGGVRHYRVWHKAGAKYLLHTAEHDTLEDLLRHHRKELYLKYALSGGPFDDLFRAAEKRSVIEGYMA